MRFPIDVVNLGRITCRLRGIFAYIAWKSPFSPSVFWL